MDNQAIKLSIQTPNTTTTKDYLVGIHNTATTRITAFKDAHYVLYSDAHIAHPNTLKTERSGNDLQVSLSAEDGVSPQLIIADFFSFTGQLIAHRETTETTNTSNGYSNNEHLHNVIIESKGTATQASHETLKNSPEHTNTHTDQVKPAEPHQESANKTSAPLNTLANAAANNADIPVIDKITDDVGNTQGTINPGAASNDTTPTLSGVAEFGQTINIYDNGDLIGSIAVRRNGSWSFTPTTPLQDGLHSFTITTHSGDGPLSAHSASYIILIDTQVPDRPNIKSIYDDHGSQVGYYPEGSAISDAQPTIYGRSEANSSVVIYDNGVEIAHIETGSSGNWSFTPTWPLADGAHQITLKAIDAADNESPLSAPFNFTIDTQAPGKPSIDALLDNQGQHTGEIPFAGVTDDNTPLIRGTAEPGSQITIMLDGVVWDAVTVDSSGQWSYTPDVPFYDGVHNLTVVATDQVGNTSVASDPFTFTIDSTVLTIAITDAIDNSGSKTGAISAGQPTDDTTPTLRGTACANAVVKIYDGATLLGQTKANAVGVWTFTPANQLSEGLHPLSATVTVGGRESPHSDNFELNIDLTAPTNLGIGEVTDSSGQSVSNGDATADKQPIFSGSGEPGATITLTDKGIVLGETIVNGAGQWNFIPEYPMQDGIHTIEVVITDAAGNSSAPSASYEISIGAGSPSAPVIRAVIDDVGAVTGPVAHNGVTDDNRPTLVGKATPGDNVLVYQVLDGRKIYVGESVADAAGNWSVTPNYNLPDGLATFNTISASYPQMDISNAWSVTINSSGVPVPTITTIIDDAGSQTGSLMPGGATDDQRPTLSGTAQTGHTVKIYDGEKLLGETKADTSGTWRYTPSSDLADGFHQLAVTSVDSTGQKGGTSEAWLIKIDSTAPVIPLITNIIDDSGAVTGNIGKHGTTDDQRPTLHGQAEPFSTITLYNGTQVLGKVQTDSNGTWAFTPSADLPAGQHSFSVSATDTVGNSSASSSAWPITIAPTVPTEPYKTVISAIYDDVGNSTGVIAQNGLTDDLRPTFIGTAKPGAEVFILQGPSNPPVLLGSTQADAAGNWSFTPQQDLPAGQYEFFADSLGGSASAVWPITIIAANTAKPSIDAVYETLETSNSGIVNGGSTGDQTPLITGKAEANSTVIIKNGNHVIGNVQADAEGNWSFAPTLEYGHYNLSVVSANSTGNLSEPSEPFNLTVSQSAMYDFETFELGQHAGAPLEHNGIVFKETFWWWYQTQVVEVDGSKVGFANSGAEIDITSPGGASSITLNLWSQGQTTDSVKITYFRNDQIIGEETLASMPSDQNNSLVTLNSPSGTFDNIYIDYGHNSFYVDNINVVRGESYALTEQAPYSAELVSDAASIVVPDAQPAQSNAVKQAPSQLSLADLLEDGETNLYADNQPQGNADKRVELSDLQDANAELLELSPEVQSPAHTAPQVAGSSSENLLHSGLEVDLSHV